MAIEPRRGCGYRKVGGLYLVLDAEAVRRGAFCGRLPIRLERCPCCGAGVKQSRGWQWVSPALFEEAYARPCKGGDCGACALGAPGRLGERLGLLWIGRQYYRSPEHFMVEAKSQGISRRIGALPKGFEPGRTWVALAHPAAITEIDDDGRQREIPGVIAIFRPARVELVLRESDAKDEVAMRRLRRRGITPVVVPDDDPDHGPASGRKTMESLFDRLPDEASQAVEAV